MLTRKIMPLMVLAAFGLSAAAVQAGSPEGSPVIDVDTTAPASMAQPLETWYLRPVAGTRHMQRVYYFDRLDVNGDGELSRSEIPREMTELRLRFADADWNRNGRISADEYRMWVAGTAPRYTEIWHGHVTIASDPKDELIADFRD